MIKKTIVSVILAMSLMCGATAYCASPSPTSSPTSKKSSSVVSPSSSSSNPNSNAKSDDEKTSTTETSQVPTEFPQPHAEAAIVIDKKTGDILYEKNKSEKLFPASTTKIMTGILALEKGSLNDQVTATQEAISPITNEHSHMGIKVGETFTLEQLLYGLLVYSANDAANVIAVHISGSLDAFTELMNAKAAELELDGTHFQNAHGFHDDNHYTTAQDLATLTKYAMQNEKFCEIVKTGMYRIPANELYTQERVLSSTNHLISRYRNTHYVYKYAVGVKTGHTGEAGNCLVAAATKNNIELISVILKADTAPDATLYAFADTIAFFDYAFQNYQYCKIAALDSVVSDSAVYEAKSGMRVALSPANEIEKLLPISVKTEDITSEITLNEKIKAPVAKGDIMGSIAYQYKGQEIAKTNLIASNDVAHDKLLAVIHIFIKIITNPFFIIAVLAIIILILLSHSKRKKQRRKRRNQLKYANHQKRRY